MVRIYITDYGQQSNVIMHKVTFEGLRRLDPCITAWAEFLTYHLNALNHCWCHVKKSKFAARGSDPLTSAKEYLTPFPEFLRNDGVFAMVCNEMVLYDRRDESEYEKNQTNNDVNTMFRRKL